ncbi:MAG: hypothetical protein ABSG15_11280 [FCB group bacterium]|jgi:hypothetical protein
MKKKVIYISGTVLLIALIGGAIGLYMYFKPVKNFATSKADYVVTAQSLYGEFAQNETTANKKYVTEDKTVQISGKISDINKTQTGAMTITLDAGTPDGDISCTLIKEAVTVADKYKKGSDITIKGQCTGIQELINKEVIMMRCAIVE